MTSDAVKPRRRYDNRRREEQALQARRRILDAAYRLFLDQGYPGTTMAAVAGAAGVSVETVYKSFGTKAALAKKVWDVTLVGDDQPVPLARRPEFTAITAEPDPRRKLAAYAAVGRLLIRAAGPAAGGAPRRAPGPATRSCASWWPPSTASGWPGPPGSSGSWPSRCPPRRPRPGAGPRRPLDADLPDVCRMLVEAAAGRSTSGSSGWPPAWPTPSSGRSGAQVSQRTFTGLEPCDRSLPPTWAGQDAGRQAPSTTR